MKEEIKKEYSNGELTVVWKPSLCIHAATCVDMLPKVYNPNETPWIKAENASTEELKNQIDECPSGALTYYSKNQALVSSSNMTTVTVSKDGPLVVRGLLEVTRIDGTTAEKDGVTAFCRCGASGNMPYCDGSHKKIGFTD